jgi:hypothetical protein
MSEAFQVKLNYGTVDSVQKYPPLPFILKDKFNDLWMVVKDADCDTETYRLVSLTYQTEDILNERDEKGHIIDHYYDSLEDLMKANYEDEIVNIELIVNGRWNG